MTGLGGAPESAPPALATLFLRLCLGEVPPGPYVFSYSYKKPGENWMRFSRALNIVDQAPINVGVDMEVGDSIACLQICPADEMPIVNMLADSTPILSGSFRMEYDSIVLSDAARAIGVEG